MGAGQDQRKVFRIVVLCFNMDRSAFDIAGVVTFESPVHEESAAVPTQKKVFVKLYTVLVMFTFRQAKGINERVHNLRNLPDHFNIIRESLQSREILDVLAREGVANAQLLAKWLGKIGLGISSRAMNELLDRMEKDAMVRTEQVDDFRVVHLRRFGGEVAAGLEKVDWVAVPRLLD